MKQKEQLQLSFGEHFMAQHAGRLMSDSLAALVELVANSWDAGSTNVNLTIPLGEGRLEIKDNGSGMSEEDFLHRWCELSYDRLKEQGAKVTFPKVAQQSYRIPFGRNGIGRHAMFCFNDEYEIVTSAGEEEIKYLVKKSFGTAPYELKLLGKKRASYTGTSLSTTLTRNFVNPNTIGESIGERFVSDPNFTVYVNQNKIEFTQLQDDSNANRVGDYVIHRIGGDRSSNTKYRGIAWWVNGRLVGPPSWDGVEGRLLDGRASLAHRYTYIVKADPLASLVKPDWSGFYSNEKSIEARRDVGAWVGSDLLLLSADTRGERKRSVLKANEDILKTLPQLGKVQVANFVDEIQKSCPTMGEKDLEFAARAFANMEKARSGFSLLEKLSQLQPNDLDGLTLILSEWSINDARKVLDELGVRLRLIESLEGLVEKSATDELHDLQPLFEQGLWIFGPEFESLSFISNRTLSTVIKEFFGTAALETPRRRPDFVVLPSASIGVYACDKFDHDHEVIGFEKVVIVELKKGASQIGFSEKDQALGYARELRRSGRVGRDAVIKCFVLGSTVSPEAEDDATEGNTVVVASTYERILKRAHSRTFNLLKKIELMKPIDSDLIADGLFSDEQIEDISISGQKDA